MNKHYTSLFAFLLFFISIGFASAQDKGTIGDKSNSGGKVIFNGQKPLTPIPSIDNSYCTDGGVDEITPEAWDPTAVAITWNVYSNFDNIPQTGWYDIVGTGVNTKLNFYPDRVDAKYLNTTFIVFEYTQRDGFGGPVRVNYDYTKVYKTPSIFNLSPISPPIIELCSGQTIDLTLSGSDLGYDYNLLKDGIVISPVPQSGTGNPIVFSNIGATGLYAVEGALALGTPTCIRPMNEYADVIVHPRPTPTITSATGLYTVCEGSTGNVYSTEGGTNSGYVWSVSAGNTITSGQGTNSVTVSWLVSGSQAISVNYNNDTNCPALTPVSKTITVNPLPTSAPIISGTPIVCAGDNGVGYSIAAIANAISYSWNYTGSGATISNGTTNSISINFSAIASSGILTVRGQNACGNGVWSANYNIVVNPLPIAAGVITGTTPVCQGKTGVAYSVPAITNATTYSWVYSGTGATINGTGNSVTIDFSTTATAGNLTVRGQNACGSGAFSAPFAIAINPLPDAAGPITGTTTPCQGANGVAYSISPIINATGYSWSYSGTGATISGGTTNNITINFSVSATSGVLTARGTNGCGNGVVSTLNINISNLPETPSVITGTTPVCAGDNGVGYSIIAIPSATTYSWNYTGSGATISNGTTNSISINFSAIATSGVLTVRGQNACGNGVWSANYNIIVNPLPIAAGVITGTTPVCQGKTGVAYSVPAITNATTYNWVYSGTGATINVTGNSATIDFSTTATAGNLTVRGQNACGSGAFSAPFAIAINPLPDAAAPITGTTTPCQGANGVAYSISPIVNATGYSWIYSGTGATISGGTTNNITINFSASATSGVLTARGTNGCGNGVVSTLNINISNLPETPSIITGISPVCAGDNGVGYSIAAIANAISYSWNYTGSGAAISNGTTNSISINFSAIATSGILTVRGQNACGNGVWSANYNIVVNPLPIAAGVITGTTPVCQGKTGVAYSVPAITNATTYSWVYSGTGATINGTGNSVIIDFANNATSGNLTVQGQNLCGVGTVSSLYAITVSPIPSLTITGNASVCSGSLGVDYSTTAGLLSYNWVVTGGTIFSGQGTAAIKVDWGVAGAGSVRCDYKSLAGCDGSTTKAITKNTVAVSLSASPSVVCAGGAVTYQATATLGSGDYNYMFERRLSPAGAWIVVANSNSNIYSTSTSLAAGIYDMKVTVTDNINGCTVVSSNVGFQVLALPSVTLDAIAPESCVGSAVTFTASPAGFSNYKFNIGSTVVDNGSNNVLTTSSLAVGAYSVFVQATSGTCSASSTPLQPLTVRVLPVSTLISDQIGNRACENEVVSFTASGGTTYEFFVGGVSQGAATAINTFTHSSLNDFAVSVDVSDGTCKSSSIVNITINKPVAGLSASKSTICKGESVLFTASGGATYTFTLNGVGVQGPLATSTYTPAVVLNNSDVIAVSLLDTDGCPASNTGITMVVNDIPTSILTSNDADNTICAGESVTYTASSDVGSEFEFMVNSSVVQARSAVATYVYQPVNGDIITVNSYNSATSCFSVSTGITMVVNALPVVTLNVNPGTSVFLGSNVMFTASGGVDYQWLVNSVMVLDYPSSANYNTSTLADGDVVTVNVRNANGCVASDSKTISVFDQIVPLPLTVNYSNYCTSSTGVIFTLNNPQAGIIYELIRTSDDIVVGTAVVNVTDVKWFDIKNNSVSSDEYRVEGYHPSFPSSRIEMANRITITEYALPIAFDMSPSGVVNDCNAGVGYPIALSDSESGVTYTLYINGTASSNTQIGNGSVLSFGNAVSGGKYWIVAQVDAVPYACETVMNNSFEIDLSSLGTAYTLGMNPADGRFCAGSSGVNITLANSDVGLTYNLLHNNIIIVTVVSAGGAIDFGTFNISGIYTANVEVAGGCNIAMVNSLSITEVALPIVYDLNTFNSGYFCENDPVGLSIALMDQEAGVEYQLLIDGVAVGALILGTTPSIPLNLGTYNITGVYSVVATIPGVGCQTTTVNNVTLTSDALPIDIALYGNDTYCAGGGTTTLSLDNTESNTTYRLYLDGVLEGQSVNGDDGTTQSFIVGVAGTYSVEAIANHPNTSCARILTSTITVIESALPDDKLLNIYNGTSCIDGTVITVLASQTGVTYDLYSDTNNLPVTGYSLTGDGSDLPFAPLFDSGGDYYVMANLNGCSTTLSGGLINVNIPGVVRKFAVSQPSTVCQGDDGVVVVLSNSELGYDYKLYLTGGDISTGGDLLMDSIRSLAVGAISFTKVYAEGEYYVVGSNPADNTCDNQMLNHVDVKFNPLPLSYVMTGSGFFCGSSNAVIGLDNSEAGVNYQLMIRRTNGLIPVGASKLASGGPLSFIGINVAGTYEVYARTSPFGCTSSMNNSITVASKPLPNNYTVTANNTGYCGAETGAKIDISGMDSGVTYVITETTSGDVSEIVGWTDSATPVELTTLPEGSYNFVATWGGDACPVNLNALPVDITKGATPTQAPTFILDKNIMCGNDTNMLTVTNVEAGLSYDLMIGGTSQLIIQNSINATDIISWDLRGLGINNTVNVYAYVAGNEICGIQGLTPQLLSSKPTPYTYSILPNDEPSGVYTYCPGEDGVVVGMDSTEIGVFYELYNNLGMPGFEQWLELSYNKLTVPNGFNFINPVKEGAYQVVGTYLNGGCTSIMNGFVLVTEDVSSKCTPIEAVGDNFIIPKGESARSFWLRTNDKLDTLINMVDVIGLTGNIRFSIDIADQNIEGNPISTKGIVTIDNITGILSYEKEPYFYGRDTIVYRVTNTDFSGLSRSDTAIVIIFMGNNAFGDNGGLLIPNAFSPNGDGYNQTLRISGLIDDKQLNIDDSRIKSNLEVYNRWGTIVYRSKGDKYKNDWDGHGNAGAMVSIGNELPNGTYYYIFKLTYIINAEPVTKEYNGYIELRR